MAYCRQCRIGTLDGEGRCVLCGAEQVPPTRSRRVAEAGGAVLSALLNPVTLVVVVILALAAATAGVTRYGLRTPAMALPLPWRSADAVLAQSRTDPGGALMLFLLPALIQAVLFTALLLLVVVLWRRLRGRGVGNQRA